MDFVLVCGRRPDESASLGSHEPLVTIADIPIRFDGRYIERQHSRRVRTVDKDARAGASADLRQLVDREDERRRRGDMIENSQSRARGKGGFDRLDNLRIIQKRKRNLGLDDFRTSAARGLFSREQDGRIAMIDRQNLIALVRSGLNSGSYCIRRSRSPRRHSRFQRRLRSQQVFLPPLARRQAAHRSGNSSDCAPTSLANIADGRAQGEAPRQRIRDLRE